MSGSVVRSYAPERVLVLVSGFQITGYADDTFVDIAPNADLTSYQVGSDGEVARSISSNKTCTVTLTLQQASPANDFLTGLIEIDSLTGGRLFPVTVSDLTGRTVFVASQAWISKRPNITFAREVSNREWQIITGTPSIWFAGGSI